MTCDLCHRSGFASERRSRGCGFEPPPSTNLFCQFKNSQAGNASITGGREQISLVHAIMGQLHACDHDEDSPDHAITGCAIQNGDESRTMRTYRRVSRCPPPSPDVQNKNVSPGPCDEALSLSTQQPKPPVSPAHKFFKHACCTTC